MKFKDEAFDNFAMHFNKLVYDLDLDFFMKNDVKVKLEKIKVRCLGLDSILT